MSRKLNERTTGITHLEPHDEKLFLSGPRRPKVKQLSPGIYNIGVTQGGDTFVYPMTVTSDGLLTLPDETSQSIFKDIQKFWQGEMRKKFQEFELVYKRGILLYGTPGTGKTCIISRIMEEVVNSGGVAFFEPSPQALFHFVNGLREIQPEVKILVVYEEFETHLDQNEGGFLSLLDGELQLDNIVYLATTNYIDQIPARIKNRPSRFARVVEVGMPNADVRRHFIVNKIKGTQFENNTPVEDFVKASEGMTIDHIKDLLISVLCFENTLEETVKKLKSMSHVELSDEVDEDFWLTRGRTASDPPFTKMQLKILKDIGFKF